MANPDFIDESVSDQTGAGPTTVFFPATWAANQIALLFIATDGGVPTLSTPNGFVLATDPNGNAAGVTTNGGVSGASDCGIHVFWKRLLGSTTGTDPAPVVAAASTWGGTCQTMHINTYSNCRTSGLPFHIIATQIIGTATTSIAPPAVTPTLNGCTLVTCCASANDDSAFNAWTFAGSANPTGILDNGWHGPTGNGASFVGGRAGYATAGGARSGTSTFGASTKQAQVTMVLASLPELGTNDDVPPSSAALGPSGPTPIAAVPGFDEIATASAGAIVEDDGGRAAQPIGSTPPPQSSAAYDETPPAASSTAIIDVAPLPLPLTGPALLPQVVASYDEVPTPVAPGTIVDDADAPPPTAAALPISGSAALAYYGADDDLPGGVAPTGQPDEEPWLDTSLRIQLAPVILPPSIEEIPVASVTVTVGGGGDIQRSFQIPPQTGTLTTIAPIPSWAQSTAYVIDPTTAGINRVQNGGNLYQCSGSGTSSSSGTGPSGTGGAIADGTATWAFVGTVLSTNTTAGSQVIAAVMRGNQSQVPGGAIDPTDNDGGSFTVISNNAYASFPASFAGVWRRSTASNNKTNYAVSAQFGGSGGAGDEMSVCWAVLNGVVVGAPHAFSHVERAAPTGGTVTAAPITITKRCIVVSFWFGNGNVQTAGTPDAATPAGGLTLIANATAARSLTVSGYIQHMVAFRFANPGTFAEVWTSSPTNEGAQLVTVAFEDPSVASMIDESSWLPAPWGLLLAPPLEARSSEEIPSPSIATDEPTIAPPLWADRLALISDSAAEEVSPARIIEDPAGAASDLDAGRSPLVPAAIDAEEAPSAVVVVTLEEDPAAHVLDTRGLATMPWFAAQDERPPAAPADTASFSPLLITVLAIMPASATSEDDLPGSATPPPPALIDDDAAPAPVWWLSPEIQPWWAREDDFFALLATAATSLRGRLAILGSRFGLLQEIGRIMIDLIGPIDIDRGDTLALRLTVTDDADERIDLTGASIELEVKPELGGPDPATIAKAVGNGITILTQAGATLGQADVTLTSSDTDIAGRLYFIDVVTVDSAGRHHVIHPRAFTVRDVVNAP